jgi:hypothetical protein
MDLEVVLDDQVPSHDLYATFNSPTLRITVSPSVEPELLGALADHIGLAVADAVDAAK